MSTGIPFWLQDHCDRLTSNDATLHNLNLNIRHLDATQLGALTNALSQNSILSSMNLTASLVSPDPVSPESLQLLLAHPTLKVLHLSYNRLLDASLLSLRAFHLVKLQLDHNSLENPHCLWEALRHNTTLQVLLLDYNRITDAACPALAAALQDQCSTLRELGLRHNCINTAAGASRLLDVLVRSNTTLRQLHVEGNEGISTDHRTKIDFWCLANAKGRGRWKSLTSVVTTTPFWLSEVVQHPSVLILLLRTRPDIVVGSRDLPLRRVTGQKRSSSYQDIRAVE